MNFARVLRQVSPSFFWPVMRAVYRRGLGMLYWGNRVTCVCCGGRFRAFRPFGSPTRANALCPNCGALERHRLVWHFLQNQTPFFQKPLRVLHVAPPAFMFRTFQKLPHHYVPVDLYSPLADIRLDVMHLPFEDDTFDVILCNHVLEHVLDDVRAMQEFYRILKPEGWAILQVPVLMDQETFEVPSPELLPAQERVKLFGQDDHVRQYGCDYVDRLKQAGFRVETLYYGQQLGVQAVEQYGLMDDEPIFCVKK